MKECQKFRVYQIITACDLGVPDHRAVRTIGLRGLIIADLTPRASAGRSSAGTISTPAR